MKIDEKAVVPVSWVLSGYAAIISVTVIGAFWVSSVNYRLERIEEKLGIPQYRSDASQSTDALTQRGVHDDTFRLSRSFPVVQSHQRGEEFEKAWLYLQSGHD